MAYLLLNEREFSRDIPDGNDQPEQRAGVSFDGENSSVTYTDGAVTIVHVHHHHHYHNQPPSPPTTSSRTGSVASQSEPPSYEEVVSAIFPLSQTAESEEDPFARPAQGRGSGSRERYQRVGSQAESEDLGNLGLVNLFRDASIHSPPAPLPTTERGAHGDPIEASSDPESNWDSIGNSSGQSEEVRTCLGEGIVNARIEIGRLFLFAVLQIRTDSPRITSSVAWQSLSARLIRERVFGSEHEVVTAWRFAFNEPTHAHFRSVFESSVSEIRNMWREVGDE